MSDTDKAYNGQCLCGSVAYEIRGAIDGVHACHCGQCRRQSGHFVVGASASRSDFKLLSEEGLSWYTSSDFARRGFCAKCGSAMFWDNGGDEVHFNVGSLDQPTGLRVASHIFVADKADYYEIGDDLPKHQASESRE